jgi:hypothetical protein
VPLLATLRIHEVISAAIRVVIGVHLRFMPFQHGKESKEKGRPKPPFANPRSRGPDEFY